jgi:transposase
VDNYSTQKSAAVQRWLSPKKRHRFHFHFTPASSSWLNQVERWFGLIGEKMIWRGTFHSVDELERAIYAWLGNWNEKLKSIRVDGDSYLVREKVRRRKELAGTAH